MAERSIRSDGVYQRLLSPQERATGRKTRATVHDRSAQTKPDEQAEEFDVMDDFDETPSVGTARSRPWAIQARSLQSARIAMPRLILDEFGMVDICTLASGIDRSS